MLPKAMGKIVFILYFLCISEEAGVQSASPLSSAQPGSNSRQLQNAGDENFIGLLINEVLIGPLRGRKVTLLLEDEVTSSLASDDFLKDIREPIAVLRLPKEMPQTSRPMNVSQQFGLDGVSLYSSSNPLIHRVIVIVMRSSDALWWPLWFPPKSWNPETVILISSTLSCSIKAYLQTPMLEKTSSVALFCPEITGRPTFFQVPFTVWSWMPFASHRQLIKLGTWNPFFFGSWNRLFMDRFQDMSNKTISAYAHFLDAPLSYQDAQGVLQGLNLMIIRALAQWMKSELDITVDTRISLMEMYESVRSGQKDIFINYATVTYERIHDFDFVVPHYREGFGMVLKIPPPLPRWQNILYPLTWKVWIGVLVAMVFTTCAFHLLNRGFQNSLSLNFTIILRSLLSEPLEKVPERWRERFFLLVWWLGSWVITIVYTSNLIAVLTVPVFPSKIKTVQELVDNGFRLCMLDYGEFVDEALAESTNPTLAALGRVVDMAPPAKTLEFKGHEQCVEKTMDGTHAHSDPYSFIQIVYYQLGYGGEFYVLEEQLYPGYVAFLVAKSNPWKYKLDVGIQRIVEAGLKEKWYQDSMDYFSGYFRKRQTIQLQPLSLSHVQGPFLIFLISLFTSVLLMLGEIMFPPRGVLPTSDSE